MAQIQPPVRFFLLQALFFSCIHSHCAFASDGLLKDLCIVTYTQSHAIGSEHIDDSSLASFLDIADNADLTILDQAQIKALDMPKPCHIEGFNHNVSAFSSYRYIIPIIENAKATIPIRTCQDDPYRTTCLRASITHQVNRLHDLTISGVVLQYDRETGRLSNIETLHEFRRMKPGQLHYLDYPSIGLIIAIS